MDFGPGVFNAVNLQQIIQTKAIVCDNIDASKRACVSVVRHRLGCVVAVGCSVVLALLRWQSLDL